VLVGAAARSADRAASKLQLADAEICSLDGFSSILELRKPSAEINLAPDE
jgi:hypothetical protein